jgi:hypothetical protein
MFRHTFATPQLSTHALISIERRVDFVKELLVSFYLALIKESIDSSENMTGET